jgi:uncharacterized membrane protein YfcA
MEKNNQWKWKIAGCLFITAGVLAIINGKSGLVFTEDIYGWRARIIGILMFFYGFKLIFPGKRKDNEKNKKKRVVHKRLSKTHIKP